MKECMTCCIPTIETICGHCRWELSQGIESPAKDAIIYTTIGAALMTIIGVAIHFVV